MNNRWLVFMGATTAGSFLTAVAIALIGAGADYAAIKAAIENLSRKETNHAES